MEYWHDLITEKSWKILHEIKGKFNFILIGGWANYLWTKKFKSKDIDIIINFNTLSKLKQQYQLRKNDALKKYEIKIEEVDIDIYVPFYSQLALPLEEIKTTKIQNFILPKPEYLLILKQGGFSNRKHSEKGEKDRLDILSLLFLTDIDFKDYFKILKEHKKEDFLFQLIKIVKEFKEIKYFDFTPHKLKLKKQEILERLKKI